MDAKSFSPEQGKSVFQASADSGFLLMQKRSTSKARSGEYWRITNTA
jgi:hypothetical protein